MNYLLALDQGTTSSRALVLDQNLTMVAQAREEFAQSYPHPGWVEHDPELLWTTTLQAARHALAQANIAPTGLRALGLTNQRETAVVWDRRTGQAVHPAIVWQDRRTAPFMAGLQDRGHEAMVRELTGLVLDPYFSASKIRWILEAIPNGWERAAAGELAAGTVDSWLVYRLTGGRRHLTDVSNASRTMLMNLTTGKWDARLLELFDIPPAILPEIVPSSGRLAVCEADLFGVPLPITSIIGDQQAALFGQLCLRPGLVKCTYGTGCFLLAHAGEQPRASHHRLLATMAWQREGHPPEYAIEGSVFVGGAAIQWLRDGLGLIDSAPEINELAARVSDSGGVVLVPAFTGLGAPYWDPEARGTVFGISRGTTAAHLARATLEGIAHQVVDIVRAMEKDLDCPLDLLRADGGASASDLLLQIQADLLGLPIERPVDIESTALGAAMLAGLGIGLWASPDDLPSLRPVDHTFTPSLPPHERRQRLATWEKAVNRSLHWAECSSG